MVEKCEVDRHIFAPQLPVCRGVSANNAIQAVSLYSHRQSVRQNAVVYALIFPHNVM